MNRHHSIREAFRCLNDPGIYGQGCLPLVGNPKGILVQGEGQDKAQFRQTPMMLTTKDLWDPSYVGPPPTGGTIWVWCCVDRSNAETLTVQFPVAEAGYWNMKHYLSGGKRT